MKQVKKLLVVLPLVLVFVLSSLPVMAWPSENAGDTDEIVAIIEYEGYPTERLVFKAKNFTEDKFGGAYGPDGKAILEYIMSHSTHKAKFFNEEIKLTTTGEANFKAFVTTTLVGYADGGGKVKVTIPFEDLPDTTIGIVAVDRLTLQRVPATIHRLENKNNAKSVYDMAHEFFDWETAHGNALKDYYFLGFAPDVNNNVTDLEQEQLDKYNAGVLVWVVEKLQPLNVTHVFPDRAPLFEKIAVDYWVLEKGQINNANAAEFAKTRIQKMNEQGYVFEKAEYTPYIYRESIMKEALDVYGKKIQVDSVVSTHGIFVYYKGAVVPAPVADGEKKVDAASVQTGVQANVQAPVAAAGAQPQQLPATGVADNAFLFLSSAALMALGIFFFKKH